MTAKSDLNIFEKALEQLGDHPYLIFTAIVLVPPLCILAKESPNIIKAIGIVVREGRKNKADVALKKANLANKLQASAKKQAGTKRVKP